MTNLVNALSKTKFKASGLNLENFIFKLTSSGIALSHIKKKKQTLVFTASTVNKKAIFLISGEFGLQIQEVKTFGFFQVIKRLPFTIGSFLGLAVSMFVIFYSTSFVEKVEFILPANHSCKNYQDCIFLDDNLSEIKQFLFKNIPLGKRLTVNIKELQNNVVGEFELVESCSIKKVGTTVIVSLTEADQKTHTPYTKIVSQNNCIITSITTYSGKPLVKAGDIVKKGQVLVQSDGEILPRAKIMAKVYYTGMAIFYCNQQVLQETGESFTTTAVTLFNKQILKHKDCPYKFCNQYKTSSYITNWFLPLKKEQITYKKLQLVNKYVDFQEAKQSVLSSAKAEALKQTKGSPQECTYSIAQEGDVVRVDCFLQVIEEVGKNE